MALPFFGIGLKTDLSGPVATAEFSKFAGKLSAALSQHRLLEFEIAQLELLCPPLTLCVAMVPKDHLTSCSRMSGSRLAIIAS